ncbi:hypothetical protein H310_14718 [Aphanomyces invadans]|uniref:Tesmin/TSO1-like CXC domain-containing protein n=1 Tax=Aphanomyces invadans TaxID=157072 RepID=A0A024TB31_9STRA|nr:hypothetical protein H310_14718 [Aphanomyces invadans]ETV90542.1 hypothetical protein H310_14718 [Aphanomyces invadans]|eukprot:XP_008880858.1 hypothetical protein H310_14718 [Aphanomyces invadans]
MQSPGTLPSVEALMAEDDPTQLMDGNEDAVDANGEADTAWVGPVNELDSEFSSLILDSAVPASSAESPSSIGISPMTLHWLQHTLNAPSASGTFGALTEHEVSLLSPYVPSSTSISNASNIKDVFRGEAIDWKSFNENNYDDNDATSNGQGQWKDIPQIRPQLATVVPAPTDSAAPQVSEGGSLQKLLTTTVYNVWPLSSLHSSTSSMPVPPFSAFDSNKRKAIISPEFVQYESAPTAAAPSQAPVATRRPSKKAPVGTASVIDSKGSGVPAPILESNESKGGIRCKCTGKCRNARCACVKAGHLCGVDCKCTHCANPFVPMHTLGIDISKIMTDKCLMQNFSRIKDMEEVLRSKVDLECPCGAPTVQVQVVTTLLHPVQATPDTFVFPISCTKCPNVFYYSWCTGKLWWSKQPRKHCDICKRCGSHRNQHCYDCGHCYFAGVANSFACPCKMGGGVAPATATEGSTDGPSAVRQKSHEQLEQHAASSPLFHEDVKEKGEQCPVQ